MKFVLSFQDRSKWIRAYENDTTRKFNKNRAEKYVLEGYIAMTSCKAENGVFDDFKKNESNRVNKHHAQNYPAYFSRP